MCGVQLATSITEKNNEQKKSKLKFVVILQICSPHPSQSSSFEGIEKLILHNFSVFCAVVSSFCRRRLHIRLKFIQLPRLDGRKLNEKMKALFNLINDMNGTFRREGGWLSGCEWENGKAA